MEYTLEDFTAIYEEAISALARFEQPEFRTISEDDLFEAFQVVFQLRSLQFNAWITWFLEEVRMRSDDMVLLCQVFFTTGIRGQHKTFMLNHCDGRSQRVVLGPYVPPIEFW